MATELTRPGEQRLGLDLGTTRIKAVVVDGDGRPVASASAPTPFAEGEMRVDALLAVVRSLVAGRRVAGIGIAGMAESGAPIDRTGQPLSPVIAWHDPRGQEVVDRLRAAFGDDLPPRLGQPVRSVMTVAKLGWLVANGVTRPARWLGVPELVLHALTGAQATEHSLAARTGCYDVAAGAWLPEVAEGAGFSVGVFPPVAPAGSVMGRVTARAATDFELPAGIPVTLAGHDHLAGLVGADVGRHLAGNSVGTAETLVARSATLPDLEAVLGRGLSVTCAPGGRGWALLAGAARSGIVLERAAAALGASPADLDNDATASEPVPVSHLLDPLARGEPATLPGAPAGAVWAGLLDALAARTAAAYDRLAAVVPATTGLVVFGGGSVSEPWLAAKRRHLRVPVRRAPVPDAVARGAALTAPAP